MGKSLAKIVFGKWLNLPKCYFTEFIKLLYIFLPSDLLRTITELLFQILPSFYDELQFPLQHLPSQWEHIFLKKTSK